METGLSYEAEEYVEEIYRLQKQGGTAKTTELAQALHVVPGSITNTIEHLEKHGLVTHVPYRGVRLTAEGEALAIDVIRRHRLAERLLTDVLKAEWSSVHEDACKLEHALTKNVVALLEKRLGHPKSCPHGNPIPNENGAFKEEEQPTLAEAKQDEDYTVVRITDEKRENLAVLEEVGMKPGAHIYVVKKNREVFLTINGKPHQLSRGLAEHVYVKPEGRKSLVRV